ncbi:MULTISPECIES: restriction endonuclease subunit S [Lactococcus]|uniref:restriction endonuclease subunit S n=1 Tax=Lactococcus TaxID=1357 RepID=UPI001A8FDD82|nr:restriction endonuclease subunit S [Lactococcus sp. LG1267]QSR03668.1 restriction endonuclease subunit S [Lactococcus sp. LG1267]
MTPEQLKASILQRAMEGKLVPQDPHDEPASELLKRIKSEKEKLIKEGKIKRDKNETEIFRGDDGLHYEKFADGTVKEVEVPFDIPDSWSWTRFNSAVINRDGERKPISKALREHRQGQYDYYGASGVIDSIDDYLFDKPLMLVGEDGANLLTRRTPIAFIARGKYWVNNHAHVLDGISESFLEFISQFINSISLAPYVTGTAQPKMNQAKMNSIMVAIAPENEQIRILEKINHLFSKVDTYKSHYQNLDKLNKEFPEKLRKSILQYAMQGKLVPQDPNDEPVEVLLEKIRQEKQKLFEEGKLRKKDLQESIIYKGDDNSYYEKSGKSEVKLEDVPDLPETWRYARFKDIVHYYMGKTPPRSATEYWGADIPWVSIADMPANGVITDTKEKLSPQATKLFKDKISPIGTLLMSFKLTVGRVSLLGIEAAHNEAIISIFPYADSDKSIKMYLFKFLPQIANNGDSKDAIKGTTLNSQSINELLIPLPPLQEQLRIIHAVEKFDNLIPRLG